MEIKLSAAKQDKQRCPFCHADIFSSEATTGCVRCSATFHEECWEEHGGCTNCPPMLVNGAAPRPTPILRGRLIRRRPADEDPGFVAVGTPIRLVEAEQKADAAAYARGKAFYPAVFALILSFLVTVFLNPAYQPIVPLLALDLAIPVVVYGAVYATQRESRRRFHRLGNLRRRRDNLIQSPNGLDFD